MGGDSLIDKKTYSRKPGPLNAIFGWLVSCETAIMAMLCTRQQKRHWCIEQSYGLCGRGREWEDLGEWHWNM